MSRDPGPASEETPPRLEVRLIDGYVAVLFGGYLKAHAFDEYRYYEALAVVPMLVSLPEATRRVLVAGGGDGLAARRLLPFSEIDELYLCEPDRELVAYGREGLLNTLNKGSLDDPRVKLVDQTTVEFLHSRPEPFDLIVCDLPHPLQWRPGHDYTWQFFWTLKQAVAPGGKLVAGVPWVKHTFACVCHNLQSLFPHAHPYKVPIPSLQGAGFVLCTDAELERFRPMPDWTRYLNDETLPLLFGFPKDETVYLGPASFSDPAKAAAYDYA